MERKYQVFISSTFEDLKEERKLIMQILLELDFIPSGMELFQASDDSQWKLIKKVISSCDYYIVIIAGRYGSVHPITQKSYTQMEYEYALQIGIPIVAFLYDNIETLPIIKSERTKKNQKKLLQFRKLAQTKMVRFWSDKTDLVSAVSSAMLKIVNSHPRSGWIRANDNQDDNISDIFLQQFGDFKKELYSSINELVNYKENEKRPRVVQNKNMNNNCWSNFKNNYKFYKQCTKQVEYSISYYDELNLGTFHIDVLKEIANIILYGGYCAFANFLKTSVKPGITNISVCKNLYELEKNINSPENFYYSEFEGIISGCFYLHFYDKFVPMISYYLDYFKKYDRNELYKAILFELGSIYVGASLTCIAEITEDKTVPLNYGINKKKFDKPFLAKDTKFILFSSPYDDENGQHIFSSNIIFDIKSIKNIFRIFDLYV